jgi:EamA domain-containing membrane protein RarD
LRISEKQRSFQIAAGAIASALVLLNAIVFGGFAAVALVVAVVGVAGVLAFAVSGPNS